MPLSRYFIKFTTTTSALNSIVFLLHSNRLRTRGLIRFQSFSQHFTLLFPLWNLLLFCLLSLRFLIFSFKCNILGLIINNINFERFSFGLENLLTDSDVLLKSLGFKFTSASFRTFLKYDIFLIFSKLGHLMIYLLDLRVWLDCSLLGLFYRCISRILIMILGSIIIFRFGIDLSVFERCLLGVFGEIEFIVSCFDRSVFM